MMRTNLLGLLLIAPLIACGESSNESAGVGKVTSAVQGGKVDTKAAHTFAVGIASRYGAICSGTLIAPNLVLTARHCIVPVDPDASAAVSCDDKFPSANAEPSTLFVTTSTRLHSREAKFYEVKSITTPKDRGFCGNDIALITLQENIPESEAEPAIPVVQFSMTDRSKIGEKIVALGYGNTSPTAQDSGMRRIHEGIGIACVPGDDSYTCRGMYRSDSEKEFITEGYVCSGDSGGGAFEQESFTDGKPYVLGALSRGPQTEERCLAAIYSRTDAHAELIISTAKKAVESGGYEPPSWLSPLEDTVEGDSEDAPECEEETCTETDATDPGDETGEIGRGKASSTGCSAAPTSTSGSTVGLVLAAAALVVARRRRRD